MDIKAPLEKYQDITGWHGCIDDIARSIHNHLNSGVDYEFRTTVVKGQLEFDDFQQIGKLLNGAKRYYLQKFVPSKVLDETFCAKTSYSDTQFETFMIMLRTYIKEVYLR